MGEARRRKKLGCEVEYKSEEKDINKTGYDEEPAKYMAAPAKGFWRSIKKVFNIKEKK